MERVRSHDIMEHVDYDLWDMPLYIRSALLSEYAPSLHGLCHWHDDLEFVRIQQGHMSVNIDGEIVLLEEGEGIFINSRHLLIHTDLTMGQIADLAGFSGSGYFAERFRQYFRCTPTEYRCIHKLQ